MPVTRSTVTNELTQVFGLSVSRHPLFETFVEIGVFLGNVWYSQAREKMTGALTTLEQQMGLVQGNKHKLTSVLTDFEEHHSFNVLTEGDGYKHAKVYLTFIPPATFLAQLRAGFHWKDPTVSPEHGEFTHRLQWFLIVQAGILGSVQPKDVLKACGELERKDPPPNARQNSVERTDLWELLFDRDTKLNPNSFLFPIAESDGDFRCPNNLNAYLRGIKTADELRLPPASNYPLLQDFLRKRHKKRSEAQVPYYEKYYKPSDTTEIEGPVLMYSYVHGMSVDKVAEVVGVEPSQVAQILKTYPPIIGGVAS